MKVEDEGASVAQKKDKGGEEDKWARWGETKNDGDIRNEEEWEREIVIREEKSKITVTRNLNRKKHLGLINSKQFVIKN